LFLSPILAAEINYWYRQVAKNKETAFIDKPQEELSGFGRLIWLEEKGVISPDNWNFSLIIPKLGINAKVEPSVNPYSPAEFEEKLKTGVAHAKGSSFPDQPGTVYIFGHSTDYPWNIVHYNALFYPLKYLNKGEEILVIYDGKNFVYEVAERKVVEADEVEYLVSNGEEKKLVLQTCWPPGTTWKRLIIIAKPLKKA
jgi:sortase A